MWDILFHLWRLLAFAVLETTGAERENDIILLTIVLSLLRWIAPRDTCYEMLNKHTTWAGVWFVLQTRSLHLHRLKIIRSRPFHPRENEDISWI